MKNRSRVLIQSHPEKHSRRENLNWIVLIIALLLASVTLMGYTRETSQNIDKQRAYMLVQTNENTGHYFRNFLNGQLEWLRVFAVTAGMIDPENKEEWCLLLESEQSDDYKIGIADASGELYYGNREKTDISHREYFQHAIRGETYISKLNEHSAHEEDNIILAVPIKNIDGVITGIVAMEYSTLELGESINTINGEWDTYGVNLVINSKGQMIASYPGMEKYDTIYEMLHTKQLKDSSVEEMRQNVANEVSGCFRYYNNDTRRTLYYEPLGVNGWTIVSIGAMKQYLTILETIEQRNLKFSVAIVLFILIGLMATRNIVYCKVKRVNELKLDSLTQVCRRVTGEDLVKEVFQQDKGVKFYGCMFVDIDDFKNINDLYGHEKGDVALSSLGNILASSTREQDVVYRYGGDEFCIWLRGTGGRKEILEVGQRIFSKVEKKSVLQLSIGATIVDAAEKDWQSILKRADEAVYTAKNSGKNQIVFYEDISVGEHK